MFEPLNTECINPILEPSCHSMCISFIKKNYEKPGYSILNLYTSLFLFPCVLTDRNAPHLHYADLLSFVIYSGMWGDIPSREDTGRGKEKGR